MATIVLQAAGSFLGGYLGTFGAAIGSAAGAIGGYLVDRALIGGTQRQEGPRLSSMRPFQAEEGAPIPQVYGTARIGGNLIWATRFEEASRTERQGSKGGPKVTTYSYFANAAFAVCEGEIAGIRRIWADGREIDRDRFEIRVHQGGEDQLPDPLIAAKQAPGSAPAYRGVAYVVFDRFPVGDYGNRLPQFQFEVIRPVGAMANDIRAVALIPGSTEYGLSPVPVTRTRIPGATETLNRHVLHAGSDLVASLDELQAVCPNVSHVALVVTWFGTDLRAGHCEVRPGVTQRDPTGLSQAWVVSGTHRAGAHLVSQIGDAAAYGGTPTDRSVIDAIAEIRGRGLKVTLYPFIMMDVPAGNGLPDPHGGAEQAAYPWRGRISCHPAAGRAGTTDKTAAARTEIEAFSGSASAFAPAADTIVCLSPDDWGYRRLVLHYAHLAVMAGGVESFLLGSELRGLTTLRDGENRFPFVEEMCRLADEVRSILPQASISYGADWSEYFGHQPADGSGDLFFHLDPLWAHPAIDAVGIENYMPLSDWRDGDAQAGNPDGFSSANDRRGLQDGVTGGEGYDWFYAGEADRIARIRSPIEDGAYGKDWVYRYKDIRSWWENPHFERVGGAELPAPTQWVPASKPIWMTEIGCPAIDKGANQPNVFPDPKSSESASPYFSSRGRSDIAQRRYLEAHFAAWRPDSLHFDAARNPVAAVAGGRMVDPDRLYVWAWDARPFPAFPTYGNVWADGANWFAGHWLNGRASGVDVASLIETILGRHGLADADVGNVHQTLAGYVVDEPRTARAALEPLLDLFGIDVSERGGRLRFRDASVVGQVTDVTELVDGDGVVIETVRAPATDMPSELELGYRDPFTDYQAAQASAVAHGPAGERRAGLSFPGILEGGQAKTLADDWLERQRTGRESVTFAVAPHHATLGVGTAIRLPAKLGDRLYRIERLEEGLTCRATARRIGHRSAHPWNAGGELPAPRPPTIAGPPHALLLDLPMGPEMAGPETRLKIAAVARPWREHVLFVSTEESGFAERARISKPATMGRLLEPVLPFGEGRIDRAGRLRVELFGGALQTVSHAQLLNGANAVAIRSRTGIWEIVQFERADEVEPGIWQLTHLLRGQLGTGDAMENGAIAGADFVLLDDALTSAGLRTSEIGLTLNWRCAPSGHDMTPAYTAALQMAGGVRALLPLAPVHLACRRLGNGDRRFTWIRRGRLDADSWLAEDIPLGEDDERYLVELVSGDVVLQTAEITQSAWLCSAGSFAGVQVATLRVRQLSRAAGPGLTASRPFSL